MLLDIVLLLVGFVIIVKSSDVLVDAASSLALKLRVPKMLIALTIVSFLEHVLLKLLFLLEVWQVVME